MLLKASFLSSFCLHHAVSLGCTPHKPVEGTVLEAVPGFVALSWAETKESFTFRSVCEPVTSLQSPFFVFFFIV